MDQQPYTMPIIVRARGYRLYDLYGKRYLDLYQNNGRAVLGHRVEGLQRTMKSTAARGLLSEYPSVYDGRLEKILRLMFPSFQEFMVYRNRERAYRAIEFALERELPLEEVLDPAMGEPDGRTRVSLWRPFLEEEEPDGDFLLPVFPFPGSFAPEVVCVKSGKAASLMPPSDAVSPFLIDALIKSVSQLIRITKGNKAGRSSEFQRLADIFEWKRKGPYLNTGLDSVAYSELCKKAQSEGIILPPGEHLPVILPREFTDGELEGFTHFVREITGD